MNNKDKGSRNYLFEQTCTKIGEHKERKKKLTRVKINIVDRKKKYKWKLKKIYWKYKAELTAK